MAGHRNGGGDQRDPQVSVPNQDRDDAEGEGRTDGDGGRQISAGPGFFLLLFVQRLLHRTLGRGFCAGISVCHGHHLLSGR
jgi:hypothetical protein